MASPAKAYVAKRFEAATPNAEVLGAAFTAFFEHINASDTGDVMRQLGLTEIDPNAWYPQQIFLDFYKIAVDDPSIMNQSFVAIGMKFADTIKFPDGVETIEDAMNVLNDMNAAIHRNVPDGHAWKIEQVSDRKVIAKYNMPYHEDAAYGYLWATVKKFSPRSFVVRPIHNQVVDAPFAFEVEWK